MRKKRNRLVGPNSTSMLVATSQTSRFHTDTLETLSNDVDIKGVNISVGDRDLLVDAELKLFNGTHYGLVGQNGVGKSTLLKCLSDKTLIGFPRNINALYVEQLEGADGSLSVLETVVNTDTKSTKLRRKLKELQDSLETGDSKTVAVVLRQHNLEERLLEEDEANSKAVKRSGVRGARARKELKKVEGLVQEAEAKLKVSHEIPEEEQVNAVTKAQESLTSIREDLELRDADTLEIRAHNILSGLGFSKFMQDNPLTVLSGGWRIRAALASALLIKPDILLLDEPTNHLDLPAILSLQNYLNELSDVTIVVISHDRAFLNAVTDETIVYKECQLSYYKGNYDTFKRFFDEKQTFLRNKLESLEKHKEVAEKSIQSEVSRARKSGDDKKMASVASKQRKLKDSFVKMDVNEKGHRFKLNRDRPGWNHSTRPDIVLESLEVPTKWIFDDPIPLRTTGALVGFEEVSFRYSKSSPNVLSNVTMQVEQNARIGVIGANGQGKSTLLKLIVDQLQPSHGSIERYRRAIVKQFSQHNVDELLSCAPDETPISLLQKESSSLTEQDIRSQLGRFGIKGQRSQSSLSHLSGGEKAKITFAKVFITSVPHLLVLDEPTNHLDFSTIEALIQCVQKFKGAIVIASHDQNFITETCKDIYMVDRGNVKSIESVSKFIQIICRRNKISNG